MLNTEKALVDFESTQYSEVTRKQVMNRLRLPDKKSMASSHYTFGLLTGLSIHPLVRVITSASAFSKDVPDGLFILQIYGGFAVPIIFTFLFSIDLIIWQKYRVNFPFIMELKARDHLRGTQFATMGALYLIFFAYSCYLHTVLQVSFV
jgi:hypothetical protein